MLVFPLYLSLRGFVYALALGNTAVLKPSEDFQRKHDIFQKYTSLKSIWTTLLTRFWFLLVISWIWLLSFFWHCRNKVPSCTALASWHIIFFCSARTDLSLLKSWRGRATRPPIGWKTGRHNHNFLKCPPPPSFLATCLWGIFCLFLEL